MPRILVIDDEDASLKLVTLHLSRAGYAVQECIDGIRALGAIAAAPPDLIISDVQMPELDGYGATRQIKALPGLAATPIIAVSSFAMKGDEEKARAAGCDDYVPKPYSPMQLLGLVQGYLAGK